MEENESKKVLFMILEKSWKYLYTLVDMSLVFHRAS